MKDLTSAKFYFTSFLHSLEELLVAKEKQLYKFFFDWQNQMIRWTVWFVKVLGSHLLKKLINHGQHSLTEGLSSIFIKFSTRLIYPGTIGPHKICADFSLHKHTSFSLTAEISA